MRLRVSDRRGDPLADGRGGQRQAMLIDIEKPVARLTPLQLVKRLHPAAWSHVGVDGLLPRLKKLQLPLIENRDLPESLGRVGSLEVRLAHSAKEIRHAQRLRYKVFYEEMSAIPSASSMLARRDMDAFDAICDHLLVIDHAARLNRFKKAKPRVVGTYRLLRQDIAEQNFGFYTASEYGVDELLQRNPGARFLELGRSCVLKPYRNKRTVELLWHGIWQYICHHGIDIMIGCASLDGTNAERLSLPLSFLHHYAAAPADNRAAALPARYVSMNRMPKHEIDTRAALHALPPLIKGYLRLGATFGDGAVIDRQFGTTDVMVILRTADISARYVSHYHSSVVKRAA